ncbi:hypothetical protein L1987_84861 [Smallanthus sonchifolius]|uniref:Uncharacterized protein n=1 Tax=Smallanthus sonchifolius TaxID=185202 RepID=A0ACB8XVJ9_9ASTR|nr:hypothetical protein L1987_84861 [Smallanthus sonchifolius]
MGILNPSPGLSLDFNPVVIPKSISQFLGELSRIGSVKEKLLQVNDFVNRLESETRKIEAFRREIPLCMLLINDAIVALKEESMVLKKSVNAQPVFEEFIPIKNRYDDDDDDDDAKVEKTEEEDANENNKLASCFTPKVQSNIQIDSSVIAPHLQHTFRKQRRSWSTELHRLFVNALQQLGGSQVATPKQIRELMRVDGLTNDEVKSHLQKYRFRARRIPSSKTNQYRVPVEGGSWMSKCSSSKSGSPDGPLLNGGNNIDDEEDEKSKNYCWCGNL